MAQEQSGIGSHWFQGESNSSPPKSHHFEYMELKYKAAVVALQRVVAMASTKRGNLVRGKRGNILPFFFSHLPTYTPNKWKEYEKGF